MIILFFWSGAFFIKLKVSHYVYIWFCEGLLEFLSLYLLFYFVHVLAVETKHCSSMLSWRLHVYYIPSVLYLLSTLPKFQEVSLG